MRSVTFDLVTPDWGSTFKAKFHDKRGVHKVALPRGDADSVFGFREGEHTYFLCMNESLDSVGLTVVDSTGPELAVNNDVFLQGDEQIREILGPKGLRLSPVTIVKRLTAKTTANRGRARA